MPVRITEIPGLQGAAINAPTMSGRDPGAQALGNLAQTIGGVSQAFAQEAQTIQKSVNVAQISEARTRLSEEYANFQLENQKETDPAKRMANTMAFLNTQKQGLDQPDYSPYVRDTLTQHFDSFASSARIRSVEDAANLTIKRAGIALQNEIGEANRTGDRTILENAKATARDAGILLPEQESALDMEFDRTIQFNSAKIQAEDSPKDALEALQSDEFLTVNSSLQPEDRDKLTRYAKAQMEFKRSEEIELFEQTLYEGKLSPADLEAAENLTPKDIRAFASALQKSAGETPISRQEYLNAWKVADTLRAARTDPSVTDDQYRILHNEARTDILNRVPPSMQGDLNKELGYLSPAGRDTKEPTNPSDRSELEAIGRAQITRAHDAGAFGDVSNEAPYAAREKAARQAEDIRLETKRFIAANPNAAPADIRAYVDSLMQNSIGSDSLLLPTIPGKFSIGDDIDSLLDETAITPLDGLGEGTAGSSDLLLPKK